MTTIDIPLSVSHIYLLPCRGGYLQIDTGYEWEYSAYRRALAQARVDVSEIRFLFLTHHHDDHAGFLNELTRDSGLVIIASEKSRELLMGGRNDTSRGGGYVSRRAKFVADIKMRLDPRWSLTFPAFTLRPQDRLVEGDEDRLLRDLGVEGRIVYAPGHCIDHQVLILDDGRVFCGDAAASYPPSIIGIHYCAIFMSDMDESYRSWQKMLDHGARMVYPTHGRPFPAKKLMEHMNMIHTHDLVPVQKNYSSRA